MRGKVGLKMIEKETIAGVWKRTHVTAEAFRQGVKALVSSYSVSDRPIP